MKPHTLHCCTYFDKNYILKGLALHSSLLKHNPKAILWILCLDQSTYQILTKLKLSSTKLIKMSSFEDKKLRDAKKNRSLAEYYWTCTPSIPLFIFNHFPFVKTLIYLDSDLYFFSSLESVIREIGPGSIYTVESRYPPNQQFRNKTTGRFNVGFQIFRNDTQGLACLRRWRDQCLEWCYWKVEDGKMADQMYLNEWPDLYSKLVISQNLGVNTAPWNINQYTLDQKKKDVYINSHKLVCFHFHQLRIEGPDKFDLSPGYSLSKTTKRYIYLPYIEELKKHIRHLRLLVPDYRIKSESAFQNSKIFNLLARNIAPIYWQIKSIFK